MASQGTTRARQDWLSLTIDIITEAGTENCFSVAGVDQYKTLGPKSDAACDKSVFSPPDSIKVTNDRRNNNLIECQDCTFSVTDHSAKTTNLSSDFDFSFNQTFLINENYLVRDSFSLGTAAYQSRAP